MFFLVLSKWACFEVDYALTKACVVGYKCKGIENKMLFHGWIEEPFFKGV